MSSLSDKEKQDRLVAIGKQIVTILERLADIEKSIKAERNKLLDEENKLKAERFDLIAEWAERNPPTKNEGH